MKPKYKDASRAFKYVHTHQIQECDKSSWSDHKKFPVEGAGDLKALFSVSVPPLGPAPAPVGPVIHDSERSGDLRQTAGCAEVARSLW